MQTASHRERLISGVGGGLSILIVFALTLRTEAALGEQALLFASMGATAVLLFAVPHSLLSRPWNVIGGHMVSGLIGVITHRLVGDTVLAAALASGLAITAMYYLDCLHPPGGASALIPVIAGPAGDGYGLWMVIFPIGTGALIMVLFAVLYNLPFAWRRYPQALAERIAPRHRPAVPAGYPDISHADFVTALAELDTYVDISEEDILRIYNIAARRGAEAGQDG